MSKMKTQVSPIDIEKKLAELGIFVKVSSATDATTGLSRRELADREVAVGDWLCPTLCGCRIRIEAKWLEGDIQPDGTSFRHPIPFTIRKTELIQCCAEHRPALQYNTEEIHQHIFAKKTGFTRDELMVRNVWSNKVQVAGYLNYPIYNPTPAECLYTYLWRYCGNLWRPDTCGCHIYKSFDRFDLERYTSNIPVWYCSVCKSVSVTRDANPVCKDCGSITLVLENATQFAPSEKFHDHPLHSKWCDLHLFDHEAALRLNRSKNTPVELVGPVLES